MYHELKLELIMLKEKVFLEEHINSCLISRA